MVSSCASRADERIAFRLLSRRCPEQATDSHNVDIRADIYSLGGTLYKLLTGVVPHSGPKLTSPMEKLMAIGTSDPPSIATRRNDLRPELVAIVDRMTRRDRELRFRTPQEVIDAWNPYADPSELRSLAKHGMSLTGKPAPLQPIDALAPTQSMMREADTPRHSSTDKTQAESFARTSTAPEIVIAPADRAGRPGARKSFQSTRKSTGWLIWTAMSAGILLLIAAAGVFIINTPSGDIVIKTSGKEIPINIKGETASFIDPADGKTVKVAVDHEQKLLTFVKPGFESLGRRFDLSAGGQVMSVEFVPKADKPGMSVDLQSAMKRSSQDDDPGAVAQATFTTAFGDGLTELGDWEPRQRYGSNIISSAKQLPSTLPQYQFARVQNDRPGQALELLERLVSLTALKALVVNGENELREPFFKQLEKLELDSLVTYCPVSDGNLESLNKETRERFSTIDLFYQTDSVWVTDRTVQIVVDNRLASLDHQR